MESSRKYQDGFDDSSFAVEVTEVAVATAESVTGDVDQAITSAIQLLRDKLGMEVAFVSGAPADDDTVALPVLPGSGAAPVRIATDPSTWTRRKSDGLPKELGAAASALDVSHPRRRASDPCSAAVVGKDGERYGTLLCFPREAGQAPSAQDARSVRYAAKLIADRLDAREPAAPEAPAPAVPSLTTLDWHLLPMERHRLAPR